MEKIDEKGHRNDPKTSCFTLATSKNEKRVEIVLINVCSMNNANKIGE